MKVYGLKKNEFSELIKIIKKSLGKKKPSKAFLFGSRATGKHRANSDIDILLKSKDGMQKETAKLENLAEESDLPYKVDVVDWGDVVPEYKKSINKDKIELVDSEVPPLLDKWRICPVGEHWVRSHSKTTPTGKIGAWDGHCRLNPSGKDIITRDEIDLISELPAFKRPFLKATKNNLSFESGNKFDSLINGWVAYWNDVFKIVPPLHPNVVKALIASESGFKTKSFAKNRRNVGNAQGLVQLTKQTQKILKDRKGELKDHLIKLSQKDIWEPNQNIAAAVRWLFRKRETAKAKLKRDPSWEEVVYEYKGILRQKGPVSDDIRNTYRDYFQKL